MPALQRAFDNFWENEAGPGGVGIQDRYAAAWRHVAGRVQGLRGILGYDVMNEPWPGSRLDCSSWEGCRDFDRGPFAAFHERVFAAIRQVDDRHLLWHEPLLPFDYGAPTFTKDTGDARAGFSFHMYCFGLPGFAGGERRPCEEVNPAIFEQAEAVSKRTGDALLLTEFGANIGTPQSIIDATELADRFRVSWLEWQYDDPYSDSLSQSLVSDSSLPPAGDNVDQDKLGLLSRPYPQVVAGTPRGWGYHPDTKRFGLRYRTRGVAGERLASRLRTRVFIPPVAYPAGYRARVVGGKVVSKPNSPRLIIAAERKARRVGVKVAPR
jgi:endoglycosylceramidase